MPSIFTAEDCNCFHYNPGRGERLNGKEREEHKEEWRKDLSKKESALTTLENGGSNKHKSCSFAPFAFLAVKCPCRPPPPLRSRCKDGRQESRKQARYALLKAKRNFSGEIT